MNKIICQGVLAFLMVLIPMYYAKADTKIAVMPNNRWHVPSPPPPGNPRRVYGPNRRIVGPKKTDSVLIRLDRQGKMYVAGATNPNVSSRQVDKPSVYVGVTTDNAALETDAGLQFEPKYKDGLQPGWSIYFSLKPSGHGAWFQPLSIGGITNRFSASQYVITFSTSSTACLLVVSIDSQDLELFANYPTAVDLSSVRVK